MSTEKWHRVGKVLVRDLISILSGKVTLVDKFMKATNDDVTSLHDKCARQAGHVSIQNFGVP